MVTAWVNFGGNDVFQQHGDVLTYTTCMLTGYPPHQREHFWKLRKFLKIQEFPEMYCYKYCLFATTCTVLVVHLIS